MNQTSPASVRAVGNLNVVPFTHPQGCRSYLIVNRSSNDALAVDVHLDLVHDIAERVKAGGWKLRYVVDTHTHADHPSGSRDLAALFKADRVSHEKGQHAGTTVHPRDGEMLRLGDASVIVRHAPGHTPDHMILVADGMVFSGDSLLIGGVARTDFLGGDAGVLFDALYSIIVRLPDSSVVFPGHDYQGRTESTVGNEKQDNPWLKIHDRADFIRKLTANPPPRPANMDVLLRMNREGVDIPATLSAVEAAQFVAEGGTGSVIDVRTGAEFEGEHIPGSRIIPMDQIESRADEVRSVPAPRLLLCQTGARAAIVHKSLMKLHVAGTSVIQGGLIAYSQAGGSTVKGATRLSLERQVRIAAGALVLTGVTLGFLAHPGFFGLSAFVGAGLMFAGITDWCGMGILLSKMPWNQSSLASAQSLSGGCSASLPSACSAGAPPPST